MPLDKSDKKEKLYYATKIAIGGLYKAVSSSTDPAHTLEFSCSLINATRAALIRKFEDRIPDSNALPGILNTILKFIATRWRKDSMISGESLSEIDTQIDTIFKSEEMAKYGLEIYRDILFCDDLLVRWKNANTIYIYNKNAWSISNNLLADIHKQLFEIIDRHNLKEFPKGTEFSVDDSDMTASSISRVMKALVENGGSA